MTPDQKVAVERVRDYLYKALAGSDRESAEELASDHLLFFAVTPHISLDENGAGFDRETDLLLQAKMGDPAAWEATRQLAAYHLENGDHLSPELSKFAAGILSKTNKKPVPLNRDGKPARKNTDLRNPIITEAVIRLVEADVGINPTRNKTSPPHSACDYVAEILVSLGDPKDWDAVRKIYDTYAEEQHYWREMARDMRRNLPTEPE